MEGVLDKESNEIKELKVRMEWMEVHLKRMENWLRRNFGYFGHLNIENVRGCPDGLDQVDGGGNGKLVEDCLEKNIWHGDGEEESGRVGFISLSKILTDSENEEDKLDKSYSKRTGGQDADYRILSNEDGGKGVAKDTAVTQALQCDPKRTVTDVEADVGKNVGEFVQKSSESIEMRKEEKTGGGDSSGAEKCGENDEKKCNYVQARDDVIKFQEAQQEREEEKMKKIKSGSEGGENKGSGNKDCKKCGASFGTTKLLEFHSIKVHKKYLCKYCQKGFDKRVALTQHAEMKHRRKGAMIAEIKRSRKGERTRSAGNIQSQDEKAAVPVLAIQGVERNASQASAQLAIGEKTWKPPQAPAQLATGGMTWKRPQGEICQEMEKPSEGRKSCPPPPQLSQLRCEPATSQTAIIAKTEPNPASQPGLMPTPNFISFFPASNTFQGVNPLGGRFHHRRAYHSCRSGRNQHSSAMGQHWGVHHPSGNQVLICPVCSKGFSHFQSLQEHLLTHSLPMM